MRRLGNHISSLHLRFEYQMYYFYLALGFSRIGYPMGMLNGEFIFLAVLIHISVNGITILLGWSLILYPASHQTWSTTCFSSFTTCPFFPTVQGLIIIHLDYCNSVMTGFPSGLSHHSFPLKSFHHSFLPKSLILTLSLPLKILSDFL